MEKDGESSYQGITLGEGWDCKIGRVNASRLEGIGSGEQGIGSEGARMGIGRIYANLYLSRR